MRESDVVARIGREEFCLLRSNTNTQGAYELCERLHRDIGSMAIIHHNNIVSPTVGVSLTSTHAPEDDDFDVFYAHADEVLYRLKAGGIG